MNPFVALATSATLLCGVGALHAQTTSTLEKVKASGSIVVGHRDASIPFAYVVPDGKPMGYGWEICNKIVDEVKKVTGRSDLKVTPMAVTSGNRIPLLQAGTIDIECGSTTNNSERAKQVAFAINYFYTGTRFLVKSDSGIKGLSDLKGKKVVSTAGTTNFTVLRKINADQGIGFDLLAAKDHAEALQMVLQGRADAFGMDDILLYGLRANAATPTALDVVGDPIQVEPYAIILRRDDPTFKKLVDDTVAGLIKSGEFEKLYKKWFQGAIPPKGINLNAPMSKDLRDNLKNLSDKPAL